MNENELRGGAGPALAAHSKDASAQGQTPASSTRGQNAAGHSLTNGNADDTLSAMRDRALDAGATLIRQQPLAALTITGVLGIVFGLVLARR